MIDSETLNYFGTFEAQAHGHSKGILVKMTCYFGKYTGVPKAYSEIEEIKWFKYSGGGKISEVDKIIFDSLKENNLLD